ncbi:MULTISPECIES: winged helix-turn-helix domain-containing protein [Mesotoga]|jgi:DNA-binding transcriptional ArsR family regulator|uniref:Bacterial regulatory protein, arsR family n=1 Tax=Mesotoga prima MesG1.Ag.4.2 TaxID=660470 RepID=I2F6H3_9BACT|nr:MULTISPECIES: winged helix-turn-helix domain-containing protein [Mesotoga]MCP5457817.1 winged helix-turn-helix transcriptional regulator [Thermotogota bacterium]CCU84604.1 Regulatory protein ArsR [Mesotoga infera]AFK07526.1 Bacterial regulatory protein, arsR family [Mesotoga prima MesG1.Ag.4.2]MCB1223273.1 winged helix-turn-helix transcriptional regulator [Mesotoga sp.]MCP5461294.1 winged helix-turn-helix transcriptional regulator [Thermotogota bacterium]
MEIITGYFEIYDLTMAIQFSLNTGPVEKVLKTLGVDYEPSSQLLEFRETLLKDEEWSTRMYITFMNELGVMAPILFPIRQKLQDGMQVTIEESLNVTEEGIELIRDRFIQVFADRRLKISHDELNRMISEEPQKVSKAIEAIGGVSPDTVWFVHQLLFFPKTAMDFLSSKTMKILNYYEGSGLRDLNTRLVKGYIESSSSQKIKDAFSNYLDYYDIVLDETKPVYITLQNSVPHTNSGLMTYPTFHLLIMGLEEVTEDFSGRIPQEVRLRSLLKVLSDETRFKILKRLSKEPALQKDLVEFTGLAKSTISYHMGLLFKSSLIDVDPFSSIICVRKETVRRAAADIRNLLNLRDMK